MASRSQRQPAATRLAQVALLLVLTALSAGLVASDLLAAWERDAYDVLCRAGVRPDERSPDVSLILLDEASLDWGRAVHARGGLAGGTGADDALNRAWFLWPWDRVVYDLLIQYLADCGADVFLLDVELAGPHPCGDGAGDDGLGLTTAGQNVAGTPLVVHSLNFETSAERQTQVEPLDALQRNCLRGAVVEVAGWRTAPVRFDRSDIGPYSNPILPYRAILSAFEERPDLLRLGAVTAQPDADAVIRRARLLVGWEGLCYPSLGLAAALARLTARHGACELSVDGQTLVLEAGGTARRLPLTSSGDLLVRWRDDGAEDPEDPSAGRYPTYPAHRVLRSALRQLGLEGWQEPPAPDGYFLEPEAFAGRIVFLGANASGLRDLKATPVGEDYPGVKVHAAVAEAALAGDGLVRAPTWQRALLAAALAVAVLLLILRPGSQLLRAASVLGLAAATVAGAAALFLHAAQWWDVVTPCATIGLAYTSGTTFNYFTEGRRSRAIAGLFQHFAPAEVVRRLIAQPGNLLLQGETREITAFFSDIRGFTSLSGTPRMQENPGVLTAHLNAYLTEMTLAITECGGTVDKYIGDAVVAIFGAPLALPDHAVAACRAALHCQQRIAAFNARAAAADLPELWTRIGLYSGSATLGCVGSQHRLSYTAIGSTVNYASRMEGVNKVYGTSILAGGPTQQLVAGSVLTRLVDRVRVPGVAADGPALEAYEVLAASPDGQALLADSAVAPPGVEGAPPEPSFLAAFAEARRLYERRRFAAAREAFAALLAVREDSPTRVLYDRCVVYEQAPPAADWDGSHRIEGK